MSLAYIRWAYSVPAYKGNTIRFMTRLKGVIVGSSGPHLRVRFDQDKKSKILHPTWEVEYIQSAEGK